MSFESTKQHTSLGRYGRRVAVMDLEQFAPLSLGQPFAFAKYNECFIKVFDPPPVQKAFVFAEYLEEGSFEAHSCGNGRFIQGAPSSDLEICFGIYKTRSSPKIRVYEDNLLQWLRAVPSLHDDLVDNSLGPFISMDRLLPRYPEMSVKFDRDRREGRVFDALELFVRHFLREGSVFATFGFEYLLKRGILTEIHLRDIQSQNCSMSEDLNLLDAAIGEIEERDIKSSHPSLFMNESTRSQLQAAIKERDPIAVDKVLAMDLAFVDTKTLCLALRYYEQTVFRLLLKHGAQVGRDDIISKLLYRAAKVGLMDAVQMLLTCDANKERGDSGISTTALNGAASGGHLEIVQYLVEEKGANINGNKYANPLARAIKYGHTHIIDYLLGAGANTLEAEDLLLLSQFVRTKQVEPDEILERFTAGMDDDARDRLFSTAVSGGHLRIVRYLVAAGVNVNPATQHCKAAGVNINPDTQHCKGSEDFWPCHQEHSPPLAVAASKGYLQIVRCLVEAGANVNPYTHHRDNSIAKNSRCIRPHYSPLAAAVSEGHLEIVRYLVEAGANVNPDTRHCRAAEGSPICHREHSSPLAVAASKGYLEIVRYLVEAGANVNPYNSTMKYAMCTRPRYSPLAAAIKSYESEVARFLSSVGAALLACEDDIYLRRSGSAAELYKTIEDPSLLDWPAHAAILARERRTMARRLLTKVANSCQKLFDASITQDASAGVIVFADQLGTSASVWRSGTHAIREICRGYMPRSLSDVVSTLQVANAMRSVVSPSRLGYSKKEFINDIPRWASLISPDDQPLFFEIASILWGIPASTVAHEIADNFARPLIFLQDIVKHLVRTSGLFDHGSKNSYQLQTLRQKYPSETSSTHTCEERLTLAEWHPLPTQKLHKSPPTNAPKPPDPEADELSILARITVLIAGAIFGAILLYLCLSRYGFSTLCLPILASDGGQSWNASDPIITRNSAILSLYVGLTPPVDFESCKSTDHLVSDSPPTERVREHMAAVQASYEGGYPIVDPSSAVDIIMDCSPSVSSHLAALPSATTISPSSVITTTPGSITMGTSMDGTVYCERCNSSFKLGKNGRRGQASNLQKHMKIHHPETIPYYHRVIYNCRYGCGTRDPNKSNIKAHENKHCANRKGKQPRCHGKWRQTIT